MSDKFSTKSPHSEITREYNARSHTDHNTNTDTATEKNQSRNKNRYGWKTFRSVNKIKNSIWCLIWNANFNLSHSLENSLLLNLYSKKFLKVTNVNFAEVKVGIFLSFKNFSMTKININPKINFLLKRILGFKTREKLWKAIFKSLQFNKDSIFLKMALSLKDQKSRKCC